MIAIGHRGAKGRAPENTLLSFKKAIELGADMIEFDIHLSKDGVPVVIHDDTIDRTSSAKGPVNSYTIEELKSFDFGLGEQIPTLVEVLDAAERHCKVDIEIKDLEALNPVVCEIRKRLVSGAWKKSDFMICYFGVKVQILFKLKMWGIETAILSERWPYLSAIAARLIGCGSLNIEDKKCSRGLIVFSHLIGLKINVWTVNTPEEITRFKEMGADGLIGDFPDLIKAFD